LSYLRARALPRSHRYAGWSALVTAILFGIANALWVLDQPGFGVSAPHLVRFYRDSSGRIVTGALLSLVSFALFITFASAFRAVLVELEEDELHANMAFGSVLMVVAAGFGAETINMAAALRAGDGHLSGTLAQALFDSSYVLGYNAAGIGLGLLAIAVGAAALRVRALLPMWLRLVAVALGILLLTPLSRYLLGVGFLLLGILGARLLGGAAARGRGRGCTESASTPIGVGPLNG
jgi:hypothetical protein